MPDKVGENVSFDIDDIILIYHLKEACRDYYPIKKIPCFCNVCDVNGQLKMVKKLMTKEDKINARFLELSKKYKKYSHFFDDTYQVVLPQSLKDMTREAASQNNCLLSYMCSVVRRDKKEEDMIILFIRKKDNPEKSLVTMELNGETFVQALGCNNRDLFAKEEAFVENFKEAFSLKNVEPVHVLEDGDEDVNPFGLAVDIYDTDIDGI